MKKRIICLVLAACMLLGYIPPVVRAEAMTASQALVDKMKAREGFSSTPYWDYSHYSIGYGTTCPNDKVDYYKKNPMSKAEAEAEFKKHLVGYENSVNNFATKYKLTLKQHQFDALVSFTYNCGSGWMSSTSGYFNTAVREGRTGAELLYGMALYSTAGGDYILIGRRLWEANMYINGDYGEGEKGSYPDNYRWVFLEGNGGTVRYKICAFDTKYKASLPVAFEDIPVGVDKDGNSFVYTFAGWYTNEGKQVTQLDSSLVRGQELYARWTDPEGNFRPDETLPKFPQAAVANTDCNIRKGPGTDYSKNGTLEKGQAVKVQAEDYGTSVNGNTVWCKIGESKWVTKAYLDYQYPAPKPVPAFPKQGKVVNVDEAVNVRKGPGTQYDKNGTLAKGKTVTVLEEVEGQKVNGTNLWCKIAEDKYINKYYISYVATEADRPTGPEGSDLASLKLLKKPTQLKYVQPVVEPDWEGSVLLATYKNGYQEALTVTRSMVSGFDGKKTGEQTVTATYKSKSVTFTVTVEALTAPVNFQAELQEGNKVRLTWEKASGATDYYVYYRKAGEPSFTRAAITPELSYEFTDMERNLQYEFRVLSYYVSEGSAQKGPSTPTVNLFINPHMTAPTDFQVEKTADNAVRLTWGPAKDATHYYVMYRNAKDAEFTLAEVTTGFSWEKTDLEMNVRYEFKVVAYCIREDMVEDGPATLVSAVFIHPPFSAATGLQVQQLANDKVQLQWTAGENANAYEVFYKPSTEEAYTKAGFTDRLSFEITGLSPQKSYDFKVVSYYVYQDNRAAGPESEPIRFTTELLSTEPQNFAAAQTGNGQVKLTWKAASGATHYYVYYRNAGESAFTRVGKTTGLSFTVTGLKPVGDYEFRVMSYYVDDTGSYKGPGTNVLPFSTTLHMTAATGLSAKQVDNGQVKLSWKAAEGATHYYVYYRVSGTSAFTRAGTTTGLSYTITGLAPVGDYEFRVMSYYVDGTGSYRGPGTAVLKFATKLDIAAAGSFTATLAGHDDVKLTWKAAEGATHYYVYYRKSGAKSFTRAGTTTGLTYTVKDLADNAKYEFHVMSYYHDSTGKYKGPGTAVLKYSTTRNLSAPSKVTLKLYGHDDVKITWSKVNNATAYKVYYKKASDTAYTYLGLYTGTSAKKTNLADGHKYTFRVMPCTTVNGDYYRDDSGKNATVTALKTVSTPKVAKYSSSKVKVSWTDISGESGYQIKVYSDKACTKTVTTATTTGKYKTISVKKGTTYYYRVRAYKTVDGTKIYAPWSSAVSYKLK